MSGFGDWLDEICVQIGVTEQKKVDNSGMQQAAQQIQNAAADARLQTGAACFEEEEAAASPGSSWLKSQAQALQVRMRAITRAVHALIDAGETREGRPTDPVVITLNQRQMSLGAEVYQMIANWDSLGATGQYAHYSALANRVSRLECDVHARRM